MPKKLNIKELLKANPSVDPEKLAEILKLVRELKQSGVVVNRGYDLAIPFSKRVVQADDSRETSQIHKRR